MAFKPDDERSQNWTSLTLAVSLLTIVNLGIIITIRWLLDTTDENHHPRVDGALREKLTVFLGVFSMTFCFGCWCCCCCGGVLSFSYLFCWPVYCYQYAGNCMHDIVASHQFTKEERVQRVQDQDKALEEQIRQAHGFPAEPAFTRASEPTRPRGLELLDYPNFADRQVRWTVANPSAIALPRNIVEARQKIYSIEVE